MHETREESADQDQSEGILERLRNLLLTRETQQEGLDLIHLIVNPAAGKDQSILRTMNLACKTAGVDWEVFVTKERGDGYRFARRAIKKKVGRVVVYGGDGSVMEVASGLMHSEVPMAIIPGGTANVLAIDLGIPRDLVEATALAVNVESAVRKIDLGQIGDNYFILRAGLGLEAAMVAGADRERKDRLGVLAYGLSALEALADPIVATYQLSFGDQELEVQGLTCIIANSGLIGREGLYLAPNIRLDDGLLDVIVLRRADLPTLLSLAASVLDGEENRVALQRWQVPEVVVRADPPQKIQVDVEMIAETPAEARVIPQAVRVVVRRDNTISEKSL
jgi:YegS/Rv2252/BmrU family lipid kinase